MSLIYAGIPVLNGLGPNLTTIIPGNYFGGYAGGFSGMGLIVYDLDLIYYLGKDLRRAGQKTK
jgi:hypothetical protein